VSSDFRTWFGEQMLDHDLTVTALSDMLDMYDGTIEDWLAGRAVPSPADCLRLAELFETPPQQVLKLAGHL
jgi:plasmid maintenance system antidote protein VapI